MNTLLKYLLPIGIVVIAVLLYLFIPAINDWVLHISKGAKGALVLYAAGVVLATYYAVVMGFRGKTLAYASAVIIFTATCIWLIANFDWFTELLKAHFGVWGMTGLLLLLCLVVGICMIILF